MVYTSSSAINSFTSDVFFNVKLSFELIFKYLLIQHYTYSKLNTLSNWRTKFYLHKIKQEIISKKGIFPPTWFDGWPWQKDSGIPKALPIMYKGGKKKTTLKTLLMDHILACTTVGYVLHVLMICLAFYWVNMSWQSL